MARFIATPEKIEEINRLYYEIGVKAEVARRIGCSPSTVSRYIDPNFVPSEERPEIELETEIQPSDPFNLIRDLCAADDPVQEFCNSCILSESEWAQLKEIQKLYAV